MIDQIICGDCLEVMAEMSDNAVDLVITDPPYGFAPFKGGSTIGATAPCNAAHAIGEQIKVREYKPMVNSDTTLDLGVIFRISKNQIIFGGNYFPLPTSRGWIVWDKKKKNDWNDYYSDGELVWTSFNKPLRIFRFLHTGIIREGKPEPHYHPTQKPVAVMKWIVENYSKETDIILDPFAGSGSTLMACKMLDRRYIGIDIDEEYCAIAEKRLKEML